MEEEVVGPGCTHCTGGTRGFFAEMMLKFAGQALIRQNGQGVIGTQWTGDKMT